MNRREARGSGLWLKAWVAPRKRGGLDYRDVLVRRDGLYVGKVGLDGFDCDHLDRGGVAYYRAK